MAVARTADLEVGVIYTYEQHFMPPLLSSLAGSAGGLRLRLILVDNASETGIEPWTDYVSDMVVVRNDRRLGYAPNLNRILQASRAPYVLLMNTDMYFDPQEQCLAKMVRFMDQHSECGLSGCRLYRPDGSYAFPARRFQTLPVVLGRRLGMPGLFRGAVDRYLYKEHSPHDVFECDWLSGCFLLVRRTAYEQVGEFDCRFAKYFEDVDMCLRMARAGWRVMFNGETYCYHCEQRASGRLISRDALHHLQSYYRWVTKWGLTPRPNETRKAA